MPPGMTYQLVVTVDTLDTVVDVEWITVVPWYCTFLGTFTW